MFVYSKYRPIFVKQKRGRNRVKGAKVKMAYLSAQRVSEIRKELKTLFPQIKFSITRDSWSGVNISIIEAPIVFTNKHNESINIYSIKQMFSGEALEILEKVVSVACKGVKYYETGDYGNQPSFYVWLSAGKWNKPFKLKK